MPTPRGAGSWLRCVCVALPANLPSSLLAEIHDLNAIGAENQSFSGTKHCGLMQLALNLQNSVQLRVFPPKHGPLAQWLEQVAFGVRQGSSQNHEVVGSSPTGTTKMYGGVAQSGQEQEAFNFQVAGSQSAALTKLISCTSVFMSTGVYAIRNTVNGKHYIGSTSLGFDVRWGVHRRQLARGDHGNAHLQAAWNKYGGDVFEFFILEVVPVDQLQTREQFWLDFYSSQGEVYNILPLAFSPRGYRHSEEARQKISRANSRRQHSEETKNRIAASQSGKTHSDETRERMSQSRKGRSVSEETRLKISASCVGRTASAETRAKLSAAKSGERHPLYGKTVSEETRKKIAEAQKGRVFSEEHKQKLRAAKAKTKLFPVAHV